MKTPCEIFTSPLHDAAVAEPLSVAGWHMRLSERLVGVESFDGADEARWVVAIGRPQEA